jgi:hypothetical protein
MNAAKRIVALLSAPALSAGLALPCTAFLVARDGAVLAGNNEDWTDPNTRVWLHPAKDGRYGRVYFGFSDGFPQGGMNEKGLFFDGFALETDEPAPKGREPFEHGLSQLVDDVMGRCATVAEALEWFERYEMGYGRGQLIFGDAKGDAALIERNAVVRKSGDFLIGTNFRQSKVEPKKSGCSRWARADSMLREARNVDVDLVRGVLEATQQKLTVYSNVYDLARGDIHLYLNHDFTRGAKFNLREELQRGERALGLPAFFEELRARKPAASRPSSAPAR